MHDSLFEQNWILDESQEQLNVELEEANVSRHSQSDDDQSNNDNEKPLEIGLEWTSESHHTQYHRDPSLESDEKQSEWRLKKKNILPESQIDHAQRRVRSELKSDVEMANVAGTISNFAIFRNVKQIVIYFPF